MNSSRKIFVILAVIVILPALFYSAYQISTLNETEQLMQQIYTRQLDAILFSVNQYILDITSNWANRIEEIMPSDNFSAVMQANTAITSIVVTDSMFRNIRSFPPQAEKNAGVFTQEKEKIERLFRYRRAEYRKLEPVVLTDSTFIILFVTQREPINVVGIVIDNKQFVNDVIGRKLGELAQDEFLFSIIKTSTGTPVYSTAPFPPRSITTTKQLWIFPDYVLGIRVKGETLDEVMHDRYVRNLALILVSDLVIFIGLWFVYRTIKKEMELIALKTDFVSNVSHELRTPLSLIRMFSETLEMNRVADEKKRQEYYRIILNETERLTRLINNILNFSRMESNTRKYSFKQVHVNDVVGSVLAIYSYQMESMHFTVQQQLAKDLGPISADEEAIAEAFHNLIDNAIKYSKENKFLRIETRQQRDSIVITVEDHGIGIPSEHREKIFEKFYRVSQGLVHTAKGSGLGLAIVQHIVQAHDGNIRVDSEVGRGTTFTITLPIRQ